MLAVWRGLETCSISPRFTSSLLPAPPNVTQVSAEMPDWQTTLLAATAGRQGKLILIKREIHAACGSIQILVTRQRLQISVITLIASSVTQALADCQIFSVLPDPQDMTRLLDEPSQF